MNNYNRGGGTDPFVKLVRLITGLIGIAWLIFLWVKTIGIQP